MTTSTITSILPYDIEAVWHKVRDVKNYTWRSDISRTEVVNEKQFIEYTKDGFATTFTITLSEPCKRWEFDILNDNMKGHWVGTFKPLGQETEVTFSEDASVNKIVMKPFVKGYLKKQQTLFLTDLRKALENN